MHVALVLDKVLSFRGKRHSLNRIFPGAHTQFRGLFMRPLLERCVSLKNPTPFFITSAVKILYIHCCFACIQQIYILRTLSFSTDVYQRKQEQSSSVFLQEPQRKERHTLTSIIIVSVKIVITCRSTMSLYECDIRYF